MLEREPTPVESQTRMRHAASAPVSPFSILVVFMQTERLDGGFHGVLLLKPPTTALALWLRLLQVCEVPIYQILAKYICILTMVNEAI